MRLKIETAEFSISGRVQGIGFRPFIYTLAKELDLVGTVQNMGDAGVRVQLRGRRETIDKFIVLLEKRKPTLALYEEIKIQRNLEFPAWKDFRIEKSSQTRTGGVSYIPPDLSICDECVDEVFSNDFRRKDYPFTSCVDCGPRFTVIRSLPYDRPTTSMIEFPFCESCLEEYQDPLNRRFHAQTTCCTDCGPHYVLYDAEGSVIENKERIAVQKAGHLLQEGAIIAIKGVGGTHIACLASEDKPVIKIRSRKGGRQFKPFAIMAETLKNIRKFANISSVEEEALLSIRKPIVLLKKRLPFILSKWLSPGLDSIGVMLPYAGVHHLLLRYVEDPALVMTSANTSGMPMLVNNQEIVTRLSDRVDAYLLHDREIIQRADDSVLRFHQTDQNPRFIRRSRGFIPEPISTTLPNDSSVTVGMGPEMHVAGAVLTRGKIFPTQHIGHLYHLENVDYFENAIRHLLGLLGKKNVTSWGVDLHPEFLSCKLAQEMAQNLGGEIVKVQHHHAHLSSLIADRNLPFDEDIVCITADGVGYGLDGNLWGGEILVGSCVEFERRGSLSPIPIYGGDLPTQFPGRIFLAAAASEGIFSRDEVENLATKEYSNQFPRGSDEIDVFLAQLRQAPPLFSSSLGRVLDACAIILGIVQERTYEGEPAMRLEAAAKSNPLPFEISLNHVGKMIEIPTANFMEWIRQQRTLKKSIRELATSVHRVLGKALASASIEVAQSEGIKKIGFSGGTAYNALLSQEISENVQSSGLEIIFHKHIPPGDGGIAAGQAVVAKSVSENDNFIISR